MHSQETMRSFLEIDKVKRKMLTKISDSLDRTKRTESALSD